MEKFNLEYFETYAQEKRVINEASSESLTKEIYEDYADLFDSLSDVFDFQKKKGTVHGKEAVYDLLKGIKSKVNTIMNKTKAISKVESDESFSDNSVAKKALAEIAVSLANISSKITGGKGSSTAVIPALMVSNIDMSEPEPTEEMPIDNEEEFEAPVKQESIKPKRKKIF